MIVNKSDFFLPTYLSVDTWYDAFNPDGSFTIYSNNTALSAMTDLGTKGNNQSQATGLLQPTYVTNALNGYPAVNFNGAQTMAAANGSGNTYNGAMSVFVVFSTPNVNPTHIARFFNKVGSWGADYLITANLGFSVIRGGHAGSPSSGLSNNTFYYCWEIYNGGTTSSVAFWQNGVSLTAGSVSANMVSSSNPFNWGSRDGTQHFISGKIPMICWWQRQV